MGGGAGPRQQQGQDGEADREPGEAADGQGRGDQRVHGEAPDTGEESGGREEGGGGGRDRREGGGRARLQVDNRNTRAPGQSRLRNIQGNYELRNIQGNPELRKSKETRAPGNPGKPEPRNPGSPELRPPVTYTHRSKSNNWLIRPFTLICSVLVSCRLRFG